MYELFETLIWAQFIAIPLFLGSVIYCQLADIKQQKEHLEELKKIERNTNDKTN